MTNSKKKNYRKACVMGNTVFFILLFFNIPILKGSSIPVITEFDSSQRKIFQDTDNRFSSPYFHFANIDPHNSSRIYIGAQDFVYRLNTDNINISFEKSDNLSAYSDYSSIYSQSVKACKQSYYIAKDNMSYQCQNHIRGILPKSNNELYVCGTGAYSPQDFYLNATTLRVSSIGRDLHDPSGAGSGITKCPLDPDSSHTILNVDENHGNPNNRSAIYTSLLVGNNYAMCRSGIQANHTSSYEYYPLSNIAVWTLNELNYVASFEIDQFVYFFFVEKAAEVDRNSCGEIRYPRVARVCKNDKGGWTPETQNQFVTYVKASLSCSVKTNGNPVYYNELADVQYDPVGKVFYGLFKENQSPQWGSAVCAFAYSDISNKFDNGQFYAQETANSLWSITSDTIVPKPRPSTCTLDTQLLSQVTLSFAASHMQMFGAISQNSSDPLFTTQESSYTKLLVDSVGQYSVFYLYSVNYPDEIVRVVQWMENGRPMSRRFSVLKPFDGTVTRIWDMKILKVGGKTWLYFVTNSEVVQLTPVLCSQYQMCTDCVLDPYCGWNPATSTCDDVTTSSGLLQGLNNLPAINTCSPLCKGLAQPTRSLPGTSVHMPCTSFCSPDGAVMWMFRANSSTRYNAINIKDDPNLVLTADDGLVILNVTGTHAGAYQCTYNDVVLAEHSISLSACAYGLDFYEVWMREFTSWCKAFDSYKDQYSNWVCLKDLCLENDNCIPDGQISCPLKVTSP